MRRAEEQVRPHLVDRVSWPVFATSALLLVLTLVDGMITVALLDRGCEEANPVMRFFLDRSTAAFFVAKYTLTAAFLPVALVMNQYRVFGARFRVGHLLPVLAVLYLVLIAYQVGLLVSNDDEFDPRDSRPGGPSVGAPASPGGRP